MFGLFGRSKYLNDVYVKISFFIDKAGVPKTNATFETIKHEVELNKGEALDANFSWHSLLSEQIQQVAWVHRDYLYKEKEYSSNQAAIFCISEFISNRADRGEPNDGDQSTVDMVASLKLLWHFCCTLAGEPNTSNTYAHVVSFPKTKNPFKIFY